MALVFLLVLLAVPLLELYVFVQVAGSIGFLPALAWLIGIGFVGAWVVKLQGLSTLRRANARVARGEMPTDEVVNGFLILVGGVLLLAPGFLSDAVGVLLVLPPTRALVRGTVKRRWARSGPLVVRRSTVIGGFGPGRTAAQRDVWDADSWEDATGPERPELQ